MLDSRAKASVQSPLRRAFGYQQQRYKLMCERATEVDIGWMLIALEAAREAARADEVPVGAVVVSADNKILSVARNRTRTDCDPTAHAEIVALRGAAQTVGNYRLTGATIYSTLEPCAMCAGALIQARVGRLVYGAKDVRAGAVESVFRICDHGALNHRIELVSGVLESECRQLMQEFFRHRRHTTGVASSEDI